MAFDPTKHLVTIRNRGQETLYLPVQKRVLWLRTEHPDAITQIELIHWSPEEAVCKATVTIPGRGSATDYGSETHAEFHDHLEKACTKALGRALAGLGFGTQFCDDFAMENLDGTPHVVDSPVERVVPPADHYNCTKCGKEITGTSRYSAHDLAQISIRKHGTVLCLACERKLAREGGGSR